MLGINTTGTLDIRAIDPSCPSWTLLKAADPSTQTFTVDAAYAACLRPGDEVVVGTSMLREDGHELYTVASVDGEEVRVDVVKIGGLTPLDSSDEDSFDSDDQYVFPAQHATLSGPGEPMFAMEIATLTRRMVFTGTEDENNTEMHTMVWFTPRLQTIQGAAFCNAGQTG